MNDDESVAVCPWCGHDTGARSTVERVGQVIGFLIIVGGFAVAVLLLVWLIHGLIVAIWE